VTLYLYGFVELDAPRPPSDLRGVGGGGVGLLDLGAVRGAVSAVPASEFDPGVVAERVHDLDWVAEQGALHERVVTWFVDHGGILPVRLLTLYSGAEALEGAVSGRASAIAARLEELRGLREWDLKVSYDARVLREHLGEVSESVAELERELGLAAPGRRYLLERKRNQLVNEEVSRSARRLAEDVLEAVLPLSAGARRLPLPREAGELPVTLHAAFLVPDAGEAGARLRVEEQRERLRGIGIDVSFTGPWAPYRFLGEDEMEETASEGEGVGT